MKRRIVLIIFASVLLAGCGSATSNSGKRTVVASFYPLAFAAQEVGGPKVSVENLTPTGAEPHDLELTTQAVARIERADVVLYLGHGFQPAVTDAVKDANGERIDALAGLPLHAAHGEDTSLTADPHVWLDPPLFGRIVTRIGVALRRRAAARALVAKLQRLDADYRTGLSHCRRREIVTTHAAFGYLARRYGLTQIAITGIAPESEPTPRRLARVVDVVRATHATTVFFEKLLSPRLADTVARDAGAKSAVLDPIEGLTSSEAASGATYFSLMRANLAALRKALACR